MWGRTGRVGLLGEAQKEALRRVVSSADLSPSKCISVHASAHAINKLSSFLSAGLVREVELAKRLAEEELAKIEMAQSELAHSRVGEEHLTCDAGGGGG